MKKANTIKTIRSIFICFLFTCLVTSFQACIAFAETSDSEIKTLFEASMGESYKDYDTQIDVENGNVVFRLNMGFDEELIELGKYSSDVQDTWSSMKSSFSSLCESGIELLNVLDVKNGSFTLMMVDNAHSKNANVYLCLINGITVIDVYA